MRWLSLLTAATLWTSTVAAKRGKILHIALQQNQDSISANDVVAHVASKFSPSSDGSPFTARPVARGPAFWYGNFGLGESRNLSFLVDTGSFEVGIDPGLYEPTSSSKNLHISGTNIYGTVLANGCGIGNISYNAFSDTVTQGDLVAKHQHFFEVVAKPAPNNETVTKISHDGIIGFAGNSKKYSLIGGVPFFQNICNSGEVAECRFGLAFKTTGSGKQILGGVENDLFKGKLSTFPSPTQQWVAPGNVTADGTVLLKDADILLDSGTAGVSFSILPFLSPNHRLSKLANRLFARKMIGPIKQVRKLFEKLGIQAVDQNLVGCHPAVFGYYRCDSPPAMGFQFGNGPNFNVECSAIQFADNGNNNCTVFITGVDIIGNNTWIAGQAWFQGKYVDFEQTKSIIGVAELKEKV